MEIKYLPFGTKSQLEQKALEDKDVGGMAEFSEANSCYPAVAGEGSWAACWGLGPEAGLFGASPRGTFAGLLWSRPPPIELHSGASTEPAGAQPSDVLQAPSWAFPCSLLPSQHMAPL